MSPLYLTYISPILSPRSPLYLPCISPRLLEQVSASRTPAPHPRPRPQPRTLALAPAPHPRPRLISPRLASPSTDATCALSPLYLPHISPTSPLHLRRCYLCSRVIQGRLNDVGMLCGSHAARTADGLIEPEAAALLTQALRLP